MQSGYLSYSQATNEKQNHQKRKSREPEGQNEIVPTGDGKTKKEQGAPDCNISEKLSCLLFYYFGWKHMKMWQLEWMWELQNGKNVLIK